MSMSAIKIQTAIKECDVHLKRLHFVTARLDGLFPVNAGTLSSFPDETVTNLDQFIYRFMKLQDAIGMKLFPFVAGLVSGDDSPRPFIDTLNILEKNGVIPSAEKWQELRNIRNTVAHEYPGSESQTAEALTMLFSEWVNLEQMYLSVKRYYFERLAGSE
jgi:hypothetical protein